MNKAKPTVLLLLALWVLGGLATATLPGSACAQAVISDDGNPTSGPSASGDPDMPGEMPPAKGSSSLNGVTLGLYAGHSLDPMGSPESAAPTSVNSRVVGRMWLESLIWVIRARIGW